MFRNDSNQEQRRQGVENKFVDANTLLQILWDEESRPSLRWLREQQAQRAIPYIKLGARVWFDPEEVRRCLKERWTIGKIKR